MSINNRMVNVVSLTLIALILSASAAVAAEENTITIGEGAIWHYHKDDATPQKAWNDLTWHKGPSGFGYGKGKHNTLLEDMKGRYKTVYARQQFIVSDYHRISRITLSLLCDGPFAAYINGIEVIRSKRRQTGEQYDLTGFAHELINGNNMLLFMCSNDDIDSDDFSFIPSFEIHQK